MTKQNRVSALLALATFAVACADPSAGQNRPLAPNGTSQAIIQDIINFPSEGYPTGVDDGMVILCKTGDAAGTFTFDVTVNGTPITDVTRTLGAGGGTDCGTGPIFTSAVGGNGDPDAVVITEQSQANWAVTNIDVVQHLAQGLFNAGGYNSGNRLADSEDEATATATAYVNGDMARTVTFTNDFTPPPVVGGEGCTPGYWKQDHHFDSWPAPYLPTTSFNTAMGLPGTNLFPNTFTLLDALNANGGGKNALARHAAAALLNAASGNVDYDLTVAEVQAAVLAAYNSAGQIETQKNLLAGFNEQGCPLN